MELSPIKSYFQLDRKEQQITYAFTLKIDKGREESDDKEEKDKEKQHKTREK